MIPALKYHFLTPFYDLIIRCVVPEIRIKKQVLSLAKLQPGQELLDYGSGTGTLILLANRIYPQTEIYGYDTDPRIVRIAERKFLKNGLNPRIFQSPEEIEMRFDTIVSTWVLHHLTTEEKLLAFSIIYQKLLPEGRLIIADWGVQKGPLMASLYFVVRCLDSFSTTADNVSGNIPRLLHTAGFQNITIMSQHSTAMGTCSVWTAEKM